MIQLTNLAGHPLWVRKDALSTVETIEPDTWAKGAGAVIQVDGSRFAVKEKPGQVLAKLGVLT